MAAVAADKENAGPGAPRAFSPGELKNMLGQCLKMASENKITPQNTWALPLIEHLPELIREEGGQQTNFQRASVTLDAGVKIYSYRVDSVHTETFKILGGLGRASNPTDDEEAGELGDGGVAEGEEAAKRKRRTYELNPEATLESSLEALNVKKFDLAFVVDPLFHKTSAQFDEGGAKGLLLNNLSVYRGCDIVFDSMDVPEKALDGAQQLDPHATVNLGALQAQLAALQLHTDAADRISPTLDAILELLDEAPAGDASAEAEQFVAQVAADAAADGSWFGGARGGGFGSAPAGTHQAGGELAAGDSGEAAFDALTAEQAQDGEQQQQQPADESAMEGVVAEYAYAAAPEPADAQDYDDGGDFDGGYDDYSDDEGGPQHSAVPGQGEQAAGGAAAQAAAAQQERHGEPLEQEALQWLIEAGSNGMVTRAKGWAGASHWRYRAVPQPAAEDEGEAGGSKPKKKSTARRKNDPLDFVALMEQQEEGQAPAEPAFELLRQRQPGQAKRARRAKPAAKTLLPEDHHYKAENLNRYALRPRNAIIAAAGEQGSGGVAGGGAAAAGEGGAEGPPAGDALFDNDGFDDFGGGGGDDDDDVGGDGGFDGGYDLGDAFTALEVEEEGQGMVQASRRVERVEVNYSRAAKQVDVRALKELMWRGMHSVQPPDGAPLSPDTVLQFRDILATVPEHNQAGRLEDLSVHLCFICVLHLANEHGLMIKSVPGLDQLHITNLPSPQP